MERLSISEMLMGISYWIIWHCYSYIFLSFLVVISPLNFSYCCRAAFCIILRWRLKLQLRRWDCRVLGKLILVIAVGDMYSICWICYLRGSGRKFYYYPVRKGFAILYSGYFMSRVEVRLEPRLGRLGHSWMRGELLKLYIEIDRQKTS